jgi:plastocyanin
MRMLTVGRAFAVALSIGLLTPLSAHAAEAKVTIDNFVFGPQRLTVKAGTTVTWTNQDDIPHAVVSSTGLFKSRVLDTDQSYSFTFATPGTFPYFCSLHPHMTGTIVVEGPPGGAATH